ncbi:hypothetical protein ACFY7C_36845 [Streptomyces sp. NPDC012769]|uniref:hypothetical protein n=1 Tax=Streptomyces sp. NPDC012769 TaxID=3364848 RepID=UPI00368E7247
MANASNGPINMGFVNANWVPPTGANGSFLSTPANYVSISSLRSRLATINAAYYTTAMLDMMSVNDMVYALRMSDDKTTIANYL